jgi:hypothetical protein
VQAEASGTSAGGGVASTCNTRIVVHELFRRLPVRRRSMDSRAEAQKIVTRMQGLCVIHPSMAFTVVQGPVDGRDHGRGQHLALLSWPSPSPLDAFRKAFCGDAVGDFSVHQVDSDHGAGLAARDAGAADGCVAPVTVCGVAGWGPRPLRMLFVNSVFVSKCKRLSTAIRGALQQTPRAVVSVASPSGSQTPGAAVRPEQQQHCVYVLHVLTADDACDILDDGTDTGVEFVDWDACVRDVVAAVSAACGGGPAAMAAVTPSQQARLDASDDAAAAMQSLSRFQARKRGLGADSAVRAAASYAVNTPVAAPQRPPSALLSPALVCASPTAAALAVSDALSAHDAADTPVTCDRAAATPAAKRVCVATPSTPTAVAPVLCRPPTTTARRSGDGCPSTPRSGVVTAAAAAATTPDVADDVLMASSLPAAASARRSAAGGAGLSVGRGARLRAAVPPTSASQAPATAADSTPKPSSMGTLFRAWDATRAGGGAAVIPSVGVGSNAAVAKASPGAAMTPLWGKRGGASVPALGAKGELPFVVGACQTAVPLAAPQLSPVQVPKHALEGMKVRRDVQCTCAQSAVVTASPWCPPQVIAQVDKKFIFVVSSDNSLMCVDQHAADERVQLERLEVIRACRCAPSSWFPRCRMSLCRGLSGRA